MSSLSTDNITFLQRFMTKYVALEMRDLDRLLGFIEVRTFEKKDVIISFGQVEDYINVIMKGLVRKFMNVGKRQVTMQLGTEGHIVQSELSFMLRQPSDVIIEALEPVEMLCLSNDSMNRLLAEMPQFERAGRLMITDMYLKKELRDYLHYRRSPRERFVSFMNNHPEMVQRVPQKYLASYLNMKPETFSRLKHLLRSKR